MLVSVVIPLRNAARDVASLTEQLRPLVTSGVEVVLVDDNSDDDTQIRLEELAKEIPFVQIVTGAGEGVARARNLALTHTRGEYVWFADSDDVWSPEVLTVLTARAQETGMDVVACNARKVDAATDADLGLIQDAAGVECIDSAEAMRRVLTGRLQGHLWNKLFRRSVLGDDPFPSTRAHSDLGGVLGILARANGVASAPETLYSYRIRAGSILNSRAYRWKDLPDCREIAISAAARLGIDADDPALRVFTCTQVVLPVLHESIRRRGVSSDDELRVARDQVRRLAKPRDVALLLAAGHRTAAVKLVLILTAPALYAAAYTGYRKRRWSRLDRMTTTQ